MIEGVEFVKSEIGWFYDIVFSTWQTEFLETLIYQFFCFPRRKRSYYHFNGYLPFRINQHSKSHPTKKVKPKIKPECNNIKKDEVKP